MLLATEQKVINANASITVSLHTGFSNPSNRAAFSEVQSDREKAATFLQKQIVELYQERN
jgi:hypothetical protein